MRYELPPRRISNLLKEAEITYGLDQVAATFGVAPATFSRWLRGTAKPSPKVLSLLSQRLIYFGEAPKNFLRFGELFCGPGGLACGLLQARLVVSGTEQGFAHSFAVDIDEWACRTYARNICAGDDSHVLSGDISDVDIPKLPPIDLLAFGFPCNDFSIVGEQKGVHGKYGPLYGYGVSVLDEKKPKVFIAENVGGLQSANEGKTFRIILDALQNAGPGYEITPHLYKFEQYGVPQRRHRIIIVGIRKDIGKKFTVPIPTTKYHPVTAGEALTMPPVDGLANNEKTSQSKIVERRLALLPEGENAWFLDEMIKMPDQQLMEVVKTLPQKDAFIGWSVREVREEINSVRLHVISARMSQIYRRLKASEPSYTITGSGGGGTHGYHWHENRALTNRERARLQTFPDNFIFEGSKEQVRKQIGMAVPVVGMKIIGEAILKTLAGIPYDSIPARW